MFGILRHVCYCDDNCPMPRDGCMSDQWANRIVRFGVQAADQFLANPNNARIHPQEQREAVKGSLDTLGWIDVVKVNRNTGFLYDGHERVMQALAKGDQTPIPFLEVDLTEEEEGLALLTFDWITQMAVYDRNLLQDLMAQVDTDNAALQSLLASMAEENGIIPPDFDPVGIDDQPRLDEKNKCTCPECGHEFTP